MRRWELVLIATLACGSPQARPPAEQPAPTADESWWCAMIPEGGGSCYHRKQDCDRFWESTHPFFPRLSTCSQRDQVWCFANPSNRTIPQECTPTADFCRKYRELRRRKSPSITDCVLVPRP